MPEPGAGSVFAGASVLGAVTSGFRLTSCAGPGSSIIVLPSGAGGGVASVADGSVLVKSIWFGSGGERSGGGDFFVVSRPFCF